MSELLVARGGQWRFRKDASIFAPLEGEPSTPGALQTIGFGGATSGAWTSEEWATSPTGATYAQAPGGAATITTTAVAQSRAQAKMTKVGTWLRSGELRGSVTLPDRAASKVAIHAYSLRLIRDYMNTPVDGYFLEINCATGDVTFRYAYGELSTQLAATTLTLGTDAVTVSYAIQPGAGAFVWLSTGTRPATPNLPTTEAQFPARSYGWAGFGVNNADTTARTFTFSSMVLDPLTGVAPKPVNADGPAPPDPAKPFGPPSGLAYTLAFSDDFPGTTLDTSKWNDREAWHSEPGYVSNQNASAFFRIPADSRVLTVGNSAVTLKARRDTGLPDGMTFTSCEINTRGKYVTPENSKHVIEARFKIPNSLGTWPAVWTLGEDGEWPIFGELDIFEFFQGFSGLARHYMNLHFPADVYTNPPGTFLNNTNVHQSFGQNLGWLDSWHTITLHREPTFMDLYFDGVKLLLAGKTRTWEPNVVYPGQSLALPPMLFTARQHLRLGFGVGGDAGNGLEESLYEEGDFSVDYVKAWSIA